MLLFCGTITTNKICFPNYLYIAYFSQGLADNIVVAKVCIYKSSTVFNNGTLYMPCAKALTFNRPAPPTVQHPVE